MSGEVQENEPEIPAKGRICRTYRLIRRDRGRRRGVSSLGDALKPGWEQKEAEVSFTNGHFEEAVKLGEDRQIYWIRNEEKKLLGEAGKQAWPSGHWPTNYDLVSTHVSARALPLPNTMFLQPPVCYPKFHLR